MKKFFLLIVAIFFVIIINSISVFASDDSEICPPPGGDKQCELCSAKFCAEDRYGKPYCYNAAVCIGSYYSGSTSFCHKAPYLDKNNNCYFDGWQCVRWQNFLISKYGSCDDDLDCFEGCPNDKPDWPHWVCDHKNKKCIIKNSCGKSECQGYTDCCSDGQKFPYYKCNSYKYMDGKVWRCDLEYSCGIDECDPKNNKYSDSLGTTFNADCRSYECRFNNGSYQCITNNRGKYANRFACEKECINTTTTTMTTTTTTKATTTTTLSKNTTTTKPSVTTTTLPNGSGGSTTTKPSVTTTTTLPKENVFCRIDTLQFSKYRESGALSTIYTDLYAVLDFPKNGILSNPKLEYIADFCESCYLDIKRLDQVQDLGGFMIDNKLSFGNLKWDFKREANRYTFEKSTYLRNGIEMDIGSLSPGRYEIILTCVDPDDRDYKIIKKLKLNIFPTIRWREVLPAIR